MRLERLKSLWLHKPWSRVLFLVFFFIPVPLSLMGISNFYRLPLVDQTNLEMNRPFLLNEEIRKLELSWPEQEAGITRKIWEEEKTKVPGSYEEVSSWIEEIDRLAYSAGFKMSYKLDDLKTAGEGIIGFWLIPLNIKLKAIKIVSSQAGVPSAGTPDFIKLLKEIMNSNDGLDLEQVTVLGTTVDLKEIDVAFTLWVGFDGNSANN